MQLAEVKRTFFSPFWKGVRKNHVNIQNKFTLAAFDTETCYGQVFSLGFYDGTTFKHFHGTHRNFFFDLLDSIFALPGRGHRSYAISAHYLSFDLGVLLWPLINPLQKKRQKAPRQLSFSLIKYRCTVFVALGKPCFAKIRRGGVTYHLIDTWSFYGVSLAKALETLNAPVQKLEKPHDLGKRIIPKAEVAPYLAADTKGDFILLEKIIELHREYKARLCVSLPQLAGRIFRHAYMRRDFVRLPSPLILGSLLSYHGGKNTFVGKPGWHRKVYDLDIRSAFPEAMRQLPDFENGKWIKVTGKEVRKYKHGIFKISGRLRPCPWGILFDHAFKKLDGCFSNIWVTGYELAEARASGEFTLLDAKGFAFVESDKNSESAFKRFVDNFYHLKESAENKTKRQFYKLILNSLYGKFIQRNEKEDGTKEAGAMFDPAVASLITGFVRARIHRLEHKYKSLHTATDGLLTLRRPDPKDCGDRLGQLKQENFGDCLIIRNKLYLHYDEKGNLFKRGLHGYQGDAKELLNLWQLKKSEYRIERLVKWAEAFHLGLPPGFPLQKTMKLNFKKP